MKYKPSTEKQNISGFGKKYNDELAPIVSEDNRKRLIFLSGLVAVAMLVMLGGSYFAESLEKNRMIYIVMCMICACIYVISIKVKNRFAVTGMMYLFIGALFIFGILLGTVIEPNETSVSFPILLFAMPLCFTEKPWRMNLAVLAGIIAYCFAAFATQTPIMIQYNLTNVIPYGIFSMFICSIMMRIKYNRYELQYQYEQSVNSREAQIEEISALNSQLASDRDFIQKQFAFSEAVSRDTNDIFVVDIDKNTSTCVKLGGAMIDESRQTCRNYDDAWAWYSEKYVHPDDRESLFEATRIKLVVTELTDKAEYFCRYRIIMDGEIRYFQAGFSYLGEHGSNNLVFAFRCIDDIVRDEIEQKQELRHQKDLLAEGYEIVRAVSQEFHILWLLDKHTLKMRMLRSPGAATLQEALDIDREDPHYDLEEYISHFVVPEDRQEMSEAVCIEEVLRQLETSNSYFYDYLRQDASGDRRYHQIAFFNMDQGGNSDKIVVGFRDIDQIVRKEIKQKEELQKAKDEAEAANKAKTAFLFNMSHDIRTPMNAIVGYTNLIKSQLGNKEKCEDYLEKLEKSNSFLLSLINNVLEMARIDSGKATLDEDVWATGGVSNEVMCVYAEAMRNKHIDYKMNTEVKTPYIWGDKLKVTEIMLNLVSNAYKYTPDGGKVTVSLTELPCDKEGWTIMQTVVEDTGIGMFEEYLPTIFEEFSREKNATEAKIQGTGLGMPIVKKLVDLMDGTITVESQLGKGSKFVVNIPHRIADKPGTVTEVSSSSDISVLEGKRVLLAEDNELNAEIAIEILSEFGVKVDHAPDGVECVNMLQHSPCRYYDLILMDVQMPNMNGYEATRTIRQLADPCRNQIPILAMTANAFEEDKKEALAAGMNGHLAKPINVEEMMKALAGILG